VSHWITAVLVCLAPLCAFAAEPVAARGPLDPRGTIHIPIGIPNTLDSLKTFVEAEGNFSPGFATYGIYFWVYDPETKKLRAPTMDGAQCGHSLGPDGYPLPEITWRMGNVEGRTALLHSRCASPAGEVHVVAAFVSVSTGRGRLYAALRPLGPAGGPVRQLAVSDEGDALLVDGHPALVALTKPMAAGVLPTDTIGNLAMECKMPTDKVAKSETGDCSGALCFDLQTVTAAPSIGFICPVLPGRRAIGHQWDGKSTWAQLDLAKPNPPDGGILQPDPGLDFYRRLNLRQLAEETQAYWKGLLGLPQVAAPDKRWGEALRAITAHAAIAMNDGAPDVAVINYNVFNRDGVYTANILQKSGQFDLAAKAIDYFLAHPFNGRVYPEADNPGQILWLLGEHWMLARDKEWLRRVYPGVRKLAAMIKYYRTTPGPHWVSPQSLKFGDALPKEERQKLEPGRCDGTHPEYTEAFDIAGLWRAAALAQAMGEEKDAGDWSALADSLLAAYDARFAADLGKGYGSYCVLWPCRLYPVAEGPAYERFKKVGGQKPGGWRYFPLATAHQGLLAGSRDAAAATIASHLDHEQMRGWYAFDEGGKSGSGGWGFARTTWNPSVAMPHGWAIAEMWLLLRDALLFEDGDRLVLLGGLPQEWLTGKEPIAVAGLPTYFGPCSFAWKPTDGGATLVLTGKAAPAQGFVLRLPKSLKAEVKVAGKTLKAVGDGDFLLPLGTQEATVAFAPGR